MRPDELERAEPDARRQFWARRTAKLWGELTLSGVLVLVAFTIWHLIRRGRLARDRYGPPRG